MMIELIVASNLFTKKGILQYIFNHENGKMKFQTSISAGDFFLVLY